MTAIGFGSSAFNSIPFSSSPIFRRIVCFRPLALHQHTYYGISGSRTHVVRLTNGAKGRRITRIEDLSTTGFLCSRLERSKRLSTGCDLPAVSPLNKLGPNDWPALAPYSIHNLAASAVPLRLCTYMGIVPPSGFSSEPDKHTRCIHTNLLVGCCYCIMIVHVG